MVNPPDGRYINGLRNAIQKLNRDNVTAAASQSLSIWRSLLTVAQKLQTNSTVKLTQEERVGALETLQPHVKEFPISVKLSLVAIRLRELQNAGDYDTLMEVMNPWQSGEFSWSAPMLGHLVSETYPLSRAVNWYKRTVFGETLIYLIATGAEGTAKMKSCATAWVKILKDIDVMNLDNASAIARRDSLRVFRTLVLLVSPGLLTISPEWQDDFFMQGVSRSHVVPTFACSLPKETNCAS